MHLDHRTMLGPRVKVKSVETLRKLLAYLGASSAQLAEFDDCRQRWRQRTAQITLAPGRKNLRGCITETAAVAWPAWK
jgi:hypothetical protein